MTVWTDCLLYTGALVQFPADNKYMQEKCGHNNIEEIEERVQICSVIFTALQVLKLSTGDLLLLVVFT